jgi:predicted transport protein
MPLFQIAKGLIQQIKKTAFPSEKALQELFENNLETLLRVRFVASEFGTGEKHGGRIDTLGLDENDRPTIIEFKWRDDETIINQGLFYLDWLIDHKGDYEIAAQKKLGKDIEMNWDSPRLILIAQSFSKYDAYAVNRISENIELKVYRLYENGFLLLEDFHAPASVEAEGTVTPVRRKISKAERAKVYSVEKHLEGQSPAIVELFRHLRKAINELGENVEEAPTKLYIAYKTARNFCEVQIQDSQIKMFLDVPLKELDDPKKKARDVSGIGHWGTGDTQVIFSSLEDMEYVTSLIRQSYERTL